MYVCKYVYMHYSCIPVSCVCTLKPIDNMSEL